MYACAKKVGTKAVIVGKLRVVENGAIESSDEKFAKDEMLQC